MAADACVNLHAAHVVFCSYIGVCLRCLTVRFTHTRYDTRAIVGYLGLSTRTWHTFMCTQAPA